MADPMDPLHKQPSTEEGKIEPTRNDRTPKARKGNSRYFLLVTLAAIALVALLIGAVVLIKRKGHKIVPDNRPASSLTISLPLAS